MQAIGKHRDQALHAKLLRGEIFVLNPKKIVGWILSALAIFLMADSVLAIIIGKQYMLWGLEYTPIEYRTLIEGVSESPPAVLMGIKLGEGMIGVALFGLVRKLVFKPARS